LFLAQLQAVAGNLWTPGLTVLSRNKVTLFDGALVGKATQPF
jgi:hypothetical protein